MTERKIPLRSQVDPQYTWATTDLYATDKDWEAQIPQIQAMVEKLKSCRGTLGKSAQQLLAFLKLQDEFELLADPFACYAMYKKDQDTRDSNAQKMSGVMMNLLIQADEAVSFAVPEILEISDEDMERFYQEEPGLDHYRLALTRLRRQKEHTLSQSEEALLASAGKLGQSPETIYGLLGDADLPFPDAVDSQGNAHPLSQGAFIPLEQSPDRQLRRCAFENFYGAYGQFRNTFASILEAQMKQLQFFSDARHYPSPLHAALSANEIPVEIYHNLIQAVHQGFPAMHRYMRLRKQLLGVDELHFYDIYTPLVPDQDEHVPFQEAKEIALKALAPLGEDYLDMLREGFSNRWIDVYENQGKRSGAYSSGIYGHHPFVLLNYADTLGDVFTLVHEMGHALHSYLSGKHQSVTYANYRIFVAEVASTCNESILMQYLLGQTQDAKRQAYLINYFLEQFRTTLYRQTLFAEFELWCSQQVQQGQPLTADSLCEKYAQLNRDYYGDAICPDPQIALEWARIPHFYRNFYVYQYATGFSAAIALSQRILKEGAPAVKDYLNFLSSGCSKDPVSLLQDAGVDMASPAPVENALKLFASLVEQMEELTTA
ncbi:MAG: oligoendopeptidase F [Acutalibacter sp.]